jgi:Phage baseplate assembly protein W
MSLEKNLYKNLRVAPQRETNRPLVNKSYRGISTITENSKQFKIFDTELIKQDIINHFHIRMGEKLENPNFGTIIWDVLWEPFTENLRQAIIKNVKDIINSDPRVRVNNVTVDTYEYGIQIQCELIFLNYNVSEYIQFQFDRENGLN